MLSVQQWTGDSVVPSRQGQGLPSRGLLPRAGLWTFLQRTNISCCEDRVSLRQLLGHFWVKVAWLWLCLNKTLCTKQVLAGFGPFVNCLDFSSEFLKCRNKLYFNVIEL